MSMRSSFIYGYGFNSDCDEGKLIDFIKEHKETFCESDREKELYNDMLKHIENEYDLEDFFEDYSCDNTGIKGIGAVIANIMSRETGIRFAYCQPDICKKYMDELGITDNPDYLNLEYYG